MKSAINIILLLLPLAVMAQQQCIKFPVKKLDIILNPSFELASGNCESNYIFFKSRMTISSWTSTNNRVPIGFVTQCFDTTKWEGVLAFDRNIHEAVIGYQGYPAEITIPPVLPKPLPDGNAALLITDRVYPPQRNPGRPNKKLRSNLPFAATAKRQLIQA